MKGRLDCLFWVLSGFCMTDFTIRVFYKITYNNTVDSHKLDVTATIINLLLLTIFCIIQAVHICLLSWLLRITSTTHWLMFKENKCSNVS